MVDHDIDDSKRLQTHPARLSAKEGTKNSLKYSKVGQQVHFLTAHQTVTLKVNKKERTILQLQLMTYFVDEVSKPFHVQNAFQRKPKHKRITIALKYCKSRLVRTHKIFVRSGPPTFRTHGIFVQLLTAADSLTSFEIYFSMHFIFVRKPLRTKYTKIKCIRNNLDLQ